MIFGFAFELWGQSCDVALMTFYIFVLFGHLNVIFQFQVGVKYCIVMCKVQRENSRIYCFVLPILALSFDLLIIKYNNFVMKYTATLGATGFCYVFKYI
jgi:hypothetical protein